VNISLKMVKEPAYKSWIGKIAIDIDMASLFSDFPDDWTFV